MTKTRVVAEVFKSCGDAVVVVVVISVARFPVGTRRSRPPIETGLVIEVFDGRSDTVVIIVVPFAAVAVNCILGLQRALNLRGQELGGREVSIGDGFGVLVVVSVDWWCLVGQSALRHGNLGLGLGVSDLGGVVVPMVVVVIIIIVAVDSIL
jgi:hypothetical protein